MMASATNSGPLPSGPLRSGHLPFLDSLRALAALWVVLSHVWIGEYGMNAHRGWVGFASNWLLYSHLAVDVFIVLSGFCLILPVMRGGGTLRGGAGEFFRRRARRILPPFYAALALSVLVSLALQATLHRPVHLSPAALLANVFLVQDLFLPLNVFNGPFWSIAVEWRLYFLFPLLVWSAGRRGWGMALAGAALLGGAATAALFRWFPQGILACPWYLLLFALGAWAGAVSEKPGGLRGRTAAAAACAAAACLALLLRAFPITPQGGADFGLHMPPVDAAAGLLTAAGLALLRKRPTLLPLLSWPPLAALGTFAYSLYLIHMPLLTVIRHLLIWLLPGASSPVRVGITAALLPAVIGLAYLFFLAFERPFLRRPPAHAATAHSSDLLSTGGLAGRPNR